MGLESQKFNKRNYSLLPEEELKIREQAKIDGVDEEWAVATQKREMRNISKKTEENKIASDYLESIGRGKKSSQG
jgi:hypothetical protein